MKLSELDFEFHFPGALATVKFDDDAMHSSSTIQRVDIIVEFDDYDLFLEVKDPDVPGASNPEAFIEKLKSDKLINSLAGKYRDSIFFRSFQVNQDKAVRYIVLLSMAALDDALLLTKQDDLQRAIPLHHEKWKRNSAAACVILNLAQWKRHYGETSVRRLSAST